MLSGSLVVNNTASKTTIKIIIITNMTHKLYHIFISVLILTSVVSAQNYSDISITDSTLTISVNSFIDDWHNDASNADVVYFDKIAVDGIYIGTDATELWTKDEFYLWSQKYFEKGKAWSFTTIERNIYFSDDKQYAWFDELLETGMGVCRASGVLLRNGDSWEIKHYHLSVAIPNEKMKKVKKVIEKK